MPKKVTTKLYTVLTLFPELVMNYVEVGIIQRAIKQKLISISAIQLREFGLDERGTVDDRPYGGGVGMVLRPDVVYAGIKAWSKKQKTKKARVVMLTPQGKVFKQSDVPRLAKYDSVLFVCGRYEGFDERVREFVDEEISVGDYILMGGELPALVVMEAVLRGVDGVVGKMESTEKESFSEHMLEYPQYTKPEVWEVDKGRGKKKKVLRVPKVLLSGNHGEVDKWREEEALNRTKKRRPDLLEK